VGSDDGMESHARDDDEVPTGLPEGHEEEPLGVPEADPDGTETEPGPQAMPGIPDQGEPPAAS
jgi:hypothetical protein